MNTITAGNARARLRAARQGMALLGGALQGMGRTDDLQHIFRGVLGDACGHQSLRSRLGVAGQGMAWRGKARWSPAWQRHGSHGDLQRIRWVRWGMPMRHQRGWARHCKARYGKAQRGAAWHGKA